MQDQPNHGSPRALHAGGYSVMYAMQMLERLSLGPQSVPELGRVTGLSVPAVRRTVRRLRVENYLAQDGGRYKRYRVTMRLAAVGLEAVRRSPLLQAAQPLLDELAEATAGRAHLWIAGPGDPIDLAKPVLGEDRAPLAGLEAPAGSVLDARRDHLRSLALIRDVDRWVVVAAVMDHGRVAAAVGVSDCVDLEAAYAAVGVADRLGDALMQALRA